MRSSAEPTCALRAVVLALAVLASAGLAGRARADARTDYLVRVLRTSPMMRVRAQAAISLGGVQTEPQVIDALTAALRDEHPSVRAAAAAALERHGDPSALPALQRAANDAEPAVRNAVARAIARLTSIQRTRPRTVPAGSGVEESAPTRGEPRFYVAVGRPGARAGSVSRDALEALRDFIEAQVRAMDGVVLAPDRESPGAANRVLRQRSLVGYYLDSSIVEMSPRPGGGLRVRVSVVVQTYPGRDIRSMLQGTATVTAGSGPAVERQALEAAFRSALRSLPSAMQAGAARASN